jgi:SAM-dependent methyltransferase
MKWLVKVAAFKILSALPGGVYLYRFSQEHFTKSLAPTRERVDQKMEVGLRYFEWLAAHAKEDQLLKGFHLDFGAGWHPSIPLLYFAMGTGRQYLFDVAPVLDEALVGQTVETVLGILCDPQWRGRDRLKRLPPKFRPGDWKAYLGELGICYHAPYAEVFPELAGRVDVVTSTQVLYYISQAALQGCFGNIHQSLKSGGLFLATVHLRDTFAPADPGLNQFRYPQHSWERWINSSLMSFNRFRAPDYRDLLEKAGFDIVHFEVEGGTPQDFKELEKIPIAECFKKYSREDLAAKHLFFVAQKK